LHPDDAPRLLAEVLLLEVRGGLVVRPEVRFAQGTGSAHVTLLQKLLLLHGGLVWMRLS
jgi:hypothetical protein